MRSNSHLARLAIVFAASASLFPISMSAQLDRTKPPELGPPPSVTLPPVIKRELPNGINLLIVQRPRLPLATFSLMVPRTGHAANQSGKEGIAGLVAQMMTEGTTSRSSLEIADAIAFLGIDLRVRTGWDATTVTLNTPTAQLDSALALFSDVALNPTFPDNEFERIRSERLTQLLQLKDRGPAIANLVYPVVLYSVGHQYGMPTIGTESSLKSLTAEDLRNFYTTLFVPNGATIIAVGDLDPDAITQKLTTIFSKWAQPDHLRTILVKSVEEKQPTKIYLVDKPGAEQSSFRIVTLGTRRETDDYFAIQVLNTILGGAFTSRLNLNLRETKGYTYGAFSGFDMRKEGGHFVAQSEIVRDATDSAVVEFLKELRAIRDTVPSAELMKAKQFLALQLPSSFEANSDVAGQLLSVALYDLPLDYYNHYVENIEAVTQADVQRVAQQYLDPGKIAIVIVGDRATIEPKLRALNVAPIQTLDIDGNPVP